MASARGDAPWLRRSIASTRRLADKRLPIAPQFRAAPNSPCRITSGSPVPASTVLSSIPLRLPLSAPRGDGDAAEDQRAPEQHVPPQRLAEPQARQRDSEGGDRQE